MAVGGSRKEIEGGRGVMDKNKGSRNYEAVTYAQNHRNHFAKEIISMAKCFGKGVNHVVGMTHYGDSNEGEWEFRMEFKRLKEVEG